MVESIDFRVLAFLVVVGILGARAIGKRATLSIVAVVVVILGLAFMNEVGGQNLAILTNNAIQSFIILIGLVAIVALFVLGGVNLVKHLSNLLYQSGKNSGTTIVVTDPSVLQKLLKSIQNPQLQEPYQMPPGRSQRRNEIEASSYEVFDDE